MPLICVQRRRFPARRGRGPRGRTGFIVLVSILRIPLAPAVFPGGREGGGSDRAGQDRSVPAPRGAGAGRPLGTAAPDEQPRAEIGAAQRLGAPSPHPPALLAPTGALPRREESWDPEGSHGPFWGSGDQGGSSEATGHVGGAGGTNEGPQQSSTRSCGCVGPGPGGGLGCGFQGGD